MENWKEYRIQDVCAKIVSGGTPLTSNPEFYNPGTIPWLKTGEVNYSYIFETENFISEKGLNNSSAKLIPVNSIIVAMYGQGDTAGRVAVNKIPLATNQACCNLQIDESKAHYGFVYYFLWTQYQQLVLYKTGGAQPNLNVDKIKKLKIHLPPLPTQRRIASILSTYDDLIQNYKRQIAALQSAASELYKEWFVRFRFPGYKSAKFDNGLPEGWKVEKLSNFCIITDGTHDTPKQVEDGVPLVTGKAVKNGEIDFSIPYNISLEDHEKIKKRSGLKSGDILFSNIGTVGNTCLVNYDREFSVKNMIIFKPNSIEKSMYLFHLITSDSCQQLFSAQTNGSTQQFLGLDFMRKFKILIPTNEIILLFGKKVNLINQKIQKLRDQITNLTTQRDLLLPRLMSGKLSVE